MTVKPAPVIVDGVPMCSAECALVTQISGFFVCQADDHLRGIGVPCLPAIRELHAELVQLRAERALIGECDHCDNRAVAVRHVPRGLGWHDEENGKVCRGCYSAQRCDGEPQWEDLEP